MSFRPYLAFAGNARQALTRYQEIFGGELALLTMAEMPSDGGTPANPDAIMHGALTVGDDLLMGADAPEGAFDGTYKGSCVSWSCADPDVAKRVFEGLAGGGSVQMPIGETFFSPAFGMCTDEFGVPWMILTEMPDA